MITDAPNLNILWAELIVEELIRNGVDHFIISPGSRSTPLTVAAARNPKAKTTVHFDERGAAFFALGVAKALGKPSALICTSGTAVANYFPAIVEASMSYVPLIVLTADRPPELQNTGANQTINQTNIYGEYIRHFAAIPCPDEAIPPQFVLTTIDLAVAKTRGEAGPVHINCAYREPLVSESTSAPSRVGSLHEWASSPDPFTIYTESKEHETVKEISDLVDKLKPIEKLLVVVGQDACSERSIARTGMELAFHKRPVFADITSGVCKKAETALGKLTIPNYDVLLRSERFRDQCRPEAILHLGGPIVSKRLQEYLAEVRPNHYVRIAPHLERFDPHHCVTHRLQRTLDEFFFSWGIDDGINPSEWARNILIASEKAQDIVTQLLHDHTSLSEPLVAATVCESSRDYPNDALFLGNSMPIRDFDVYGGFLDARTRVISNRGASGIDGNIATTAGYSKAKDCVVTAIIGDLTALHDLNSLSLLKQHGVRVILIVLNNNGGGIFHFLPIAEHADVFEKYFGTPHGLHFEEAARMFGLPYSRPTTKAEFVAAYKKAQDSAASCIIEVVTDREENFRLHRKISDAVVKALEQL